MLEFKFDQASLEKALQELAEKELAPVVKGLAQEVWNSILIKTPQSFGRLAASWTYSVNVPIITDNSNLVISNEDAKDALQRKKEANLNGEEINVGLRYRGHREAIGIAYRMSAGNAQSFKLGDTIYIANGADHGEGPYSEFIENIHDTNPNWLYYMNRPGAMVRRTMQNVDAKYSQGISENQAERFKGYQLS